MTGLIRKATLLAVCGLLTAGAAFASVPSVDNSKCVIACGDATETILGCIYLIGDDGVAPDPDGNFCVIVRDLANVPINNSLVVVDFSLCSGVVLCDNTPNPHTVDCGTQTVRDFSGANGVASFTIKGHGTNAGDEALYTPANCVRIFADGVLLCSPSVGLFDQDGGGVGSPDLSAWGGDFFQVNAGTGPYNRSDYDCDGDVDSADLSVWGGIFFDLNANGTSVNNCPAPPKTAECAEVP
jgi:hypothetical protein